MFSRQEMNNLGPLARERLESGQGVVELMATFDAETPQRTRRIWRVRTATVARFHP
jgi:hypothetical protein